jgi:hypothetical protein
MKKYREIKIIYDAAIEREIMKILKEFNVEKYVIVPKIKGSWGKFRKHLDEHVWPGTDDLLILVLDEEESEKILERYRELRARIDYEITFTIIVTVIEKYIV